MAEFLGNSKRTDYCGEIRDGHIGKTVTVMGWVQKTRNLGSLIFTDLRDRTGIVQLACEVNLNNFRHCDVISAAAHRYRNVKSARAHREHTYTAACGSVAVRADKRFAGLAETFQMNLVADTVART